MSMKPLRCAHCHRVIAPGRAVWRERYVCRATMREPAEYETVPLHLACAETVTDPAWEEWCQDERAERRAEERAGV